MPGKQILTTSTPIPFKRQYSSWYLKVTERLNALIRISVRSGPKTFPKRLADAARQPSEAIASASVRVGVAFLMDDFWLRWVKTPMNLRTRTNPLRFFPYLSARVSARTRECRRI